MKYTINHACGCERTVEIFGTNAHGERDKKVAWLESIDCPICKAKAESAEAGATLEEREMSYAEYKTDYADCKTKPGSYDKKAKTIVVYVPVKTAEATVADTVNPDEEIISELLALTAPIGGNEKGARNMLTYGAEYVESMIAKATEANPAEFTPEVWQTMQAQAAVMQKCATILRNHGRISNTK